MSRFSLIIVMLFACFVGECLAVSEKKLSVYEDVSGTASLQQVLDKPFVEVDGDALSAGFSSSAFWVKAKFDHSQEQHLVASSCYTQIDSLDVYIPENGAWREVNTGDTRPFSQRDVKHPCFVFALSNADQNVFYLRLASNGIIRLPLQITEQTKFWQDDQSEQLGHGFYFAFLLAMFIYNLFLFIVIRESAYLYYVGYLGGIALFLASMSGHTKMYLWPNSTLWVDVAPVILASIAISSALLFIRNMTQINHYVPTLARLMVYVAYSGAFVLVCALFNTRYAIFLLGIFMLIGLSMIAAAILTSAAKRWRPSYFLVSGVFLMLPGGIIYFGRTVGWLDESWLTNNILHLTSSVEAMVLSFALAYRIKILNQQLEQHQSDAITAQSHLSQSLLKGADYERRAIARELHDSFGQGLLVIKNMVSRFQPGEKQQQVISQLRELISDTRNMARSMHPQQIENLGFSTALETMFTETIAPTGIRLVFELDDVTGLIDKDAELQLYRIAQESAANIVKHAKATEVGVHLNINDDRLILMICDNGIGISEDIKQGMGILNMTERAAIISASFSIQPRQPQGTDIIVEVPL